MAAFVISFHVIQIAMAQLSWVDFFLICMAPGMYVLPYVFVPVNSPLLAHVCALMTMKRRSLIYWRCTVGTAAFYWRGRLAGEAFRIIAGE